MGKKLEIKDVDYTNNAISFTDVTSQAVMSRTGTSFITGTSTLTDAFSYNASAWPTRNMWVLNVSNYKGKLIRFTISGWLKAVHSSTSAVYYNCFASEISQTIPWTGTGNVQNALTPVKYIDGQKDDAGGGVTTYLEKIPSNANYLVVINNTTHLASPKFEIMD